MNVIADTNIILAVALNEPEKDRIVRLTAEVEALAPEILPYEIGNALSAMIKQKRLTREEACSAFLISQQIPVRLVTVNIGLALELAFDFNIYAYDAYFLQCAKNLRSPLITLDKRLQQVAEALNIELLW